MSKVIPTKISKSDRQKLKKLLCTKIAKLKSFQEVYDFLEDLLTESEFVMIIRRLEIAKMLLDECSYAGIRNELGVGYETIKFVRRRLDRGTGGFLKFIRGLKV